MKKVLIIISIVIASLAILVIAGLKIAPMVARSYIVGNSEDLIGRKVAIESISLNPFNFTLEIDSLAVYEKDGETPFVSFDKFRVNVDPLRMFTGTVAVSEIYLKGLYTRVLQHGDRFNFTDIIEFLAKGDTASVDSAAIVADSVAADSAGMVNAAEIAEGLPFNISVENIMFEKGNIFYQDTKIGSKIHLQDFSLNIPAVYLSNKQTDVGLSLKFADGGDLNVKVVANAATNDFILDVALKDFALACAKPYLNDFINYKDFKGTLSVNMNLAGNLNDILSSNIKGTVSVDGIELTETSGRSLGVKLI